MFTIIFIGDVVGKVGRKAIAAVLPAWRAEHKPDLIIANAENIAHGTGITEKTLQELSDLGINAFTSGNHVFDKPEGETIVSRKDSNVLRPLNYPEGTPGQGYMVLEVGGRKVGLVNIIGRVFIKEQFDCPFRAFDRAYDELKKQKIATIIVDFHAEATSEKAAFGWYVAGRASAVLGTHTHVPTADGRILPEGTAFISDVGMSGAADSVIGVGKEEVIKSFLTQRSAAFSVPESGAAVINAVLLTVNPKTGQAQTIERLDKKVTV